MPPDWEFRWLLGLTIVFVLGVVIYFVWPVIN